MRRIITLILIAAAAVFLYLLFQTDALPPENIGIAATQQGEYMRIKGKISQGSYTFRGYSYEFDGDKLLLTVKGSRLPFYQKEFDIKLSVPPQGIKEVYLKGRNGERVLQWQSENAYIPPLPVPPQVTGGIIPLPTPEKQ